MRVNDVSLHDENFWPTLTQTEDGSVYVLTNSCIVNVDGLDSIQRMPDRRLTLSPAMLAEAQRSFAEAEAKRQEAEGTDTLTVAIRGDALTVDGDQSEWVAADWVTIDSRITKMGDWGSKPDRVTAALAVHGDSLYAAFRTNDRISCATPRRPGRPCSNSAAAWI
jgi:hypothetical protein